MQRLNDERNARMVERLMPRIEEGGALSQWAPCIWPVRPASSSNFQSVVAD